MIGTKYRKLADRQPGHVTRHAIPYAAAAVLACGDDAALSLSASLALCPTRSVLEDRFRRFVGRHKLPMPEINAVVNARADH